MEFPLLIYPHAGLKRKASMVTAFDDPLRHVLQRLTERLYEFNDGVGLAATQVNHPQRIFVMDVSKSHDQPQALINPQITERIGSETATEGCLSFPGLYVEIERAQTITVRYQDESGKFLDLTASGLLSRCIQHELDHLDGIVFIDRLSRFKRARALKKYLKHQQEA